MSKSFYVTSTHKTPKQITAILAIIFLFPALYIFGIWISISGTDNTPAQKVIAFTEQFPSFIRDYKLIFYISMAFSLTAIILAAKSFKQRLLSLRIAMWLTVMIASLIFLLNIFQLL